MNLQNILYNNNIPISVFDNINDIYEKCHNELFNDALNKFIEENYILNDEENIHSVNEFNNKYKIIDLKDNSDWLKPSSLLLINKTNGNVSKHGLSLYWNNVYNTNNISKKLVSNLLISDEDKKHVEIDTIDYIKGNITFKNKFTNKTFTVPFDKIDFSLIYEEKLKDTFKYKYKLGRNDL